jgi:periplasmic protein TonB
MEVVIGVDGRVARFNKVTTDDELFTQSAMDTVRQWRYTPTLLNGVPVPVIMTIIVSFRSSR